jgi:hypothetical protein
MISLHCAFQIIFSTNWEKEISAGTLIQLLSDCLILYEIGTADYKDEKIWDVINLVDSFSFCSRKKEVFASGKCSVIVIT